ncbi:helix-turn-helix transcriptional regulator [Streptomyces sp. NPDC001795]|uniref:helix-turn-helix domain-containing protein n=1 Tax=Streptomyces sp. NPDC001795 TaxID=3154525 RepID=UPI003319B463
MSETGSGTGMDVPLEAGRVKLRLNALFDGVENPATGRPYTVPEVASATGISESAIRQLKQGSKPNPTLKTVELLADHFGVKKDYFSKEMSGADVDRVVAGLKLLDVLEKAGVEDVFARAGELSVDSMRMVAAVIRSARKAEGLDAD